MRPTAFFVAAVRPILRPPDRTSTKKDGGGVANGKIVTVTMSLVDADPRQPREDKVFIAERIARNRDG